MKQVLLLSAGFVLMCSNAMAQNTPRVIRGGVLNGKATSLPKPEYPADAKAAGVGGLVKVEVVIGESGDVESAKAVADDAECDAAENANSSSDRCRALSLLQEASERAATQARFSPTLLSGDPVKVAGVITYNFVLSRHPEEGRAINGGVLNGRAIELPNPEYPAAAKAVGVSGLVAVKVIIDESGNVIAATSASGHPLLRAAAVTAARAARFAPTRLNGEPVKVSGVITYNFVLPIVN